ncbi:MAG: hypothetical protein QM811_23425 [Pirellulales bacterium]
MSRLVSRTRLKRFNTALLIATTLGISSAAVKHTIAQLSITTAGTTVTQNFDGLPSTGTGLSQTGGIFGQGWSFLEGGSNANTTYDTGTGSNTAGNTYSFGVAGTNAVTDRAFGMLQSGNLTSILGFTFVNNTGSLVTSIDVGYTGEVWRRSAASDTLAFSYQSGAVALNSATGWTTNAGLLFTTPVTGSALTLDGNATANRTVIAPVTISGLSIANGASFTLRWVDGSGSSSAGMAIDDFSILLTAGVSTVKNLTWNLSGGGVWDTTTANWTGDATIYTSGDNTTFANTNGGTIAFTGSIAPGSTTVSAASGTYTFTGTATDKLSGTGT